MRVVPVVAVFAAGALVLAVVAVYKDIERTSWELMAPPNTAGTTFQLGVWLSACDEFERFDVREREVDATGRLIDAVTIEAFVHEGARSDCDGIILIEEHMVKLSKPLGDRPLKGCNPPSSIYRSESDASDDDCRASFHALD